MQKTLLLVEDDLLIARQGAMILEKSGYLVITARNHKEALKAVEENPQIDLALLDIDLKEEKDGTEVARDILKIRDLPIVFLSNHTDRGTVLKTEKITSYGYIVKHAGEVVLLASLKMAFRLFEANQKVKDSERFFSTLFQKSNDGNILIEAGIIIDANEAALNMLKCTDAKQLYGLAPWQVSPDFQPDGQASKHKAKTLMEFALNQGYTNFIWQHKNFQEQLFWVEVTLTTIKHGGRDILYTTWRDITLRKHYEDSLRENENKLRTIIDTSPDGIVMADLNGKITFASKRMMDILGFSSLSEILGKNSFHFISEKTRDRAITNVKNMIENHISSNNKHHVLMKSDFTEVHVEINININYDENNQPLGIIAIIRDITDKINIEEDLAKSVIEKEALLQELQHRTKNSLTLIESLIKLEIFRNANPTCKPILENLIYRIHSISQVYDLLSAYNQTERIPFAEYIRNLANSVFRAFIDKKSQIMLYTDLEELEFPAKFSTSLGLIANELLLNSIKYAFSENQTGYISIKINVRDGLLVLELSNNGLPLAVDFDPANSKGLGMQIITLLIRQLDGELIVMKEPVTCFKVVVPLVPYK